MRMQTHLVRVNLDIKEKEITKTLRFNVAVAEIKALSKKSNKVVILSHRGRPRGAEEKWSLKHFVPLLTKALGSKVMFIPALGGAKEIIEGAPGGSIFLLENLRFHPGEQKNSTRFAKRLAALGDTYINNDFATSHHKAASLVAITKYLPSHEGNIIKHEVRALTKAARNPKHPFILIIGGAKIKDKASAIRSMLLRVDAVLLGGGVGNTFLKSIGLEMGASLHEPELAKKVSRLARNKKVLLPVDHLKEKTAMFDIGPETQKAYVKLIGEAKTIVWAGPMGYFEKKKFAGGTTAVAHAIIRNKKAHAIIGGAETVYSLPIKTDKQHAGSVFLSTGGGAMLHFLAGKKLPALEALKKAKAKKK